jgi:hypothetical protein
MKVLEHSAFSGDTRCPEASRDPELIIKEARRRRRRRYLVIAVAFVTVLGAIVIAVYSTRGGGGGWAGHRHQTNMPLPRPRVPSASAQKPPGVALPSSALFNQISLTSNGLLLTGVTDTNGENSESSPISSCVAAPLDPESLAVGRLTVGSCGDPLLFGQTVVALSTPVPNSNDATLSINVANPSTGQVTSGPVVMSYASLSDTRPVIAYGNQWLWVYDNDTTNGPELLQVSTATGQVVDTIHMPSLSRPLLAPDDGGVWVANSIGGSPAPALFYVPAGSGEPRVVISATDVPVCWIEAQGTGAWIGAGLQNACAKQAVQRFVDDSEAPVFSLPGTFTPFNVIGDEADGLWTIQWTATAQQVVSIDPQTGRETIVATLPPVPEPLVNQDEGLAPGQAVYDDGGLYILQPPFRLNGYQGYTSVVRVSLRLPG